MKASEFKNFFNPSKSDCKNGSGIHQSKKLHGRLVWNSYKNGTYVRAIHGELK